MVDPTPAPAIPEAAVNAAIVALAYAMADEFGDGPERREYAESYARAALAAVWPLLTDAARAEVHEARVQADGARAQMASVLELAEKGERDGRGNSLELARALRAAVSPEGVEAFKARIEARTLHDAARDLAALWPMGARLLIERAKAVEGRA